MSINRARGIVAVAALVALALGGCKSSSSAAGGGTAASGGGTPTKAAPASTPTTAAATAPAQGKLNGVPSSCPSADLVMSDLHLSSLVVDGDDPSMCQYDFNGNKSAPYAAITFNAVPGMSPAEVKSGLTQGQKDVQDVSGVGEAAFSFKSDGPGVGLTFLSGGVVCSIFTTVATTTPDEAALADAIIQGS